MNAEEIEIARRLVACKRWIWLAGMQMVVDRCMECRPVCAFTGSVNRIVSVDDGLFGAHKVGRISGPVLDGGLHDNIPDLSDELTRLGVLAVVRRAWGMPHCGLWGNNRLGPSLRWACGEANGRIFTGETELAALLAALEAAP